MLLKELYMNSLIYEKSPLAHMIHYLLSERKVTLEDDTSVLNTVEVDWQKVKDMIERNVLGFHRIRIFSLKKSSTKFVFIFAENEHEAVNYFSRTFRERPVNCSEYLLDYEFIRGNKTITFRDMKKEHEKFPAIAGIYGKAGLYINENGLYDVFHS